jgi:hypothetical protein
VPEASSSTPTAAPPAARSRVGRVAVIVLLVALVLFWAYVFLWPRQAEDKLGDRAWTDQAQDVCERWEARLADLPPAMSFADVEPKSEALRQRADVGAQANEYLRSMVAELRALPAISDPEDADKVQLWLQDWDAYIDARDTHVEEWRAGKDERFREPPVEAGEISPISLRMDAFANTNLMTACRVPQDFG